MHSHVSDGSGGGGLCGGVQGNQRVGLHAQLMHEWCVGVVDLFLEFQLRPQNVAAVKHVQLCRAGCVLWVSA